MKKYEGRVIASCVSLKREQIDFLDQVSRRCIYSGGKKLSRAIMLRAFISALWELDVDTNIGKNENHSKWRINRAVRRNIFFRYEKHNTVLHNKRIAHAQTPGNRR